MTYENSQGEAAVTTTRKRRGWVAILLALFASPFFSMLYLGRWRRGLVYLALTVLSLVGAVCLAAMGLWPRRVEWSVLSIVVSIAGAVDAYRIVDRNQSFSAPWYSRWYGLLGVFLAFVSLTLSVRLIVEPFRIPSGAMIPTLLVGDFILVNKFTYGVRLPITRVKVFSVSDPKRGDVMVFRYPEKPSVDYIKRVVGLPGDEIIYRDKRLIINGAPVPTELQPDYQSMDDRNAVRLQGFTEWLGERPHVILINPDVPPVQLIGVREFPHRRNCVHSELGFTCKVPADHYFVMGDNRDSSSDSRYWGFVPVDNLVGRAFMIWWNEEQPGRVGLSIR